MIKPLTDDETEAVRERTREAPPPTALARGYAHAVRDRARLLATVDALRAKIEGLYTPEVYAQAIERAERAEAERNRLAAENAALWDLDMGQLAPSEEFEPRTRATLDLIEAARGIARDPGETEWERFYDAIHALDGKGET